MAKFTLKIADDVAVFYPRQIECANETEARQVSKDIARRLLERGLPMIGSDFASWRLTVISADGRVVSATRLSELAR